MHQKQKGKEQKMAIIEDKPRVIKECSYIVTSCKYENNWLRSDENLKFIFFIDAVLSF